MKRYLWILLLAACSAPTGEVANTAKTIENTAEVQNSKEGTQELPLENTQTTVVTAPQKVVVPGIQGPETKARQ